MDTCGTNLYGSSGGETPFRRREAVPWPGASLIELPVESWFTPLLALGALVGAAYYRLGA